MRALLSRPQPTCATPGPVLLSPLPLRHPRPHGPVLRDQAFVLGSSASLADVALFPFARQFAGVDTAWFATTALPGLQRWLAHWLQSPWFTRVMAQAVPTPSPGAGQ